MIHFTLIWELLTIFFAGLFGGGERYCISVPPCPDSRWGNGVSPTKYLGNGVPLHYTTDRAVSLRQHGFLVLSRSRPACCTSACVYWLCWWCCDSTAFLFFLGHGQPAVRLSVSTGCVGDVTTEFSVAVSSEDVIKSIWMRLRHQPQLLDNFEMLLRRLTSQLQRSHVDYFALQKTFRAYVLRAFTIYWYTQYNIT